MISPVTDTASVSVATPRAVHELRAETIGCRVPRTGDTGNVEAVFDRACNILLDSGQLITLLGRSAGNVAHGIRLGSDQRLNRLLRRGMSVHVGHERMSFDGGTVSVFLSAASTWMPTLHLGMGNWDGRSIDAAFLVADCLVNLASGRESEFLAVVVRSGPRTTPLAFRISEILPRLAGAVRSHDRITTLQCAANLIGLGPGLTPAGDDFLIGLLAGLTLSAQAQMQIDFLRTICSGIDLLSNATTSVSQQHLRDACALVFSERLSDLCVSIALGAPKLRLVSLVAAQVAVGASSGTDAAAGLIFALFECRMKAPASKVTPDPSRSLL
jgi:hypothetical protein